MNQKAVGLALVAAAGVWLLWPKLAQAATPALPKAPEPPATTPKQPSGGGGSSVVSAPATGMATIRRGSTGPSVIAWQKYLGVNADGDFGPATEAATKKVQTQFGLTADGVVGPKTWALATAGAKPNTVAAFNASTANKAFTTSLVDQAMASNRDAGAKGSSNFDTQAAMAAFGYGPTSSTPLV